MLGKKSHSKVDQLTEGRGEFWRIKNRQGGEKRGEEERLL